MCLFATGLKNCESRGQTIGESNNVLHNFFLLSFFFFPIPKNTLSKKKNFKKTPFLAFVRVFLPARVSKRSKKERKRSTKQSSTLLDTQLIIMSMPDEMLQRIVRQCLSLPHAQSSDESTEWQMDTCAGSVQLVESHGLAFLVVNLDDIEIACKQIHTVIALFFTNYKYEMTYVTFLGHSSRSL